jgi:hypothetical protein
MKEQIESFLTNLRSNKISIYVVIPLLVLTLFIGNEVKTVIKCNSVENSYFDSLNRLSEIGEKSQKEWDSFPDYDDPFFPGAKDPNGGGGRFYTSYEQYFEENYERESNSELRIGMRIQVQNPQCFDPREVAEAEDYLATAK